MVERGRQVSEKAERPGVSAHSLYKWVKGVVPEKAEKSAAELARWTASFTGRAVGDWRYGCLLDATNIGENYSASKSIH